MECVQRKFLILSLETSTEIFKTRAITKKEKWTKIVVFNHVWDLSRLLEFQLISSNVSIVESGNERNVCNCSKFQIISRMYLFGLDLVAVLTVEA